jgi:arginyl-tRNA synthetase
VRAARVLDRLAEGGESIPDFAAELSAAAMARQLQSEDFWQMLLAASKADAAVEAAVASGEPAHVARYAFQLAQTFSNFYERFPIIHEKNREKKVFLLWMTDFFRRQLEWTAGILGIEIPAYM